jgi:hypothetical protein
MTFCDRLKKKNTDHYYYYYYYSWRRRRPAAAPAVCFFWSSGRKRAPAAAAAGKEKFYVTDCIELTLFLCGRASAGLQSSRIFATGLIINGTVAITLKFFPCLHRREKKAL